MPMPNAFVAQTMRREPARETLLNPGAFRIDEAGMIGGGVDAGSHQRLRCRLGLLPRRGIDERSSAPDQLRQQLMLLDVT